MADHSAARRALDVRVCRGQLLVCKVQELCRTGCRMVVAGLSLCNSLSLHLSVRGRQLQIVHVVLLLLLLPLPYILCLTLSLSLSPDLCQLSSPAARHQCVAVHIEAGGVVLGRRRRSQGNALRFLRPLRHSSASVSARVSHNRPRGRPCCSGEGLHSLELLIVAARLRHVHDAVPLQLIPLAETATVVCAGRLAQFLFGRVWVREEEVVVLVVRHVAECVQTDHVRLSLHHVLKVCRGHQSSWPPR
mmetsp:Transcript_4361/g.15327  ORF Transcript_4361/g.15327 Transcript_4361/m.15327 type:complete len:247 (+) Transcript_4361:961-1701(+)